MNIYQIHKPGELVAKHLKSLDNPTIVPQMNNNAEKFDMRKLK